MAGISGFETSGGRRKLDHELPLVPFIDFMVCLVAFLMVTAVWMNMGRLEATARAPGEASTPGESRRELHVTVLNEAFQLDWRNGSTVLETERVPAQAVELAGERRYPVLSEAITRTWREHGQHRAASDRDLDRAVVHVKNDLPFDEVVAVLDALNAPRRPNASGEGTAFAVAFAAK
jgi:biopolymer transport protein ExbD